MKKGIISLLIFVMVISTMACGTKKDNNKEHMINEITFKYKELSDISPMFVNNTVKYTKEYTDATLYEWSKEVVLPVPMPEGAVQSLCTNAKWLTYVGVTEDSWNEYVLMMKEKYDGLYSREYELADGGVGKAIEYRDVTNNYYINIIWNSKYVLVDGTEESNVMTVYCYMGNQEKNEKISTQEVLEKAYIELGIKEKKGLNILDVSSHSNLKAGYSVYSLCPNKEYAEDELHAYLAIVKGDEIVCMVPDVMHISHYLAEVEFAQNNGKTEMYILYYGSVKDGDMIEDGYHVSKYVLNNGKFEENEDFKVDFLDYTYGLSIMTFEKEGNDILLYDVVVDEDATKHYYERYHKGEKLGKLN